MVEIFHDMIEKTMEVFMDDFLVFGDSFSSCLSHLDMIVKRCEDTNLVLNWEKCHFMVKDGIVFGHKISKSGIEVDHAKVDVIAKLPSPNMVKGIRSFLGVENLAADHLSRLENPHKWDLVEMEMNDNFPHKSLNMIALNDENEPPLFADIANYLVERTVGEHRAKWANKLDDALWAFCTAFKTPISCIPYRLVYGEDIEDSRLKIKNQEFHVDDRVLLFNSILKIFSGKLKSHWSGPFTITEVFPYGTVELSQPKGPNFKVNGHRIKHYLEKDIPALDVLDFCLFLINN
ncbi:reverse transcriptase domain-containing protein [Tanacetum coccineum]